MWPCQSSLDKTLPLPVHSRAIRASSLLQTRFAETFFFFLQFRFLWDEPLKGELPI